METAKEPAASPKRIIKRYSNRKLYDTKDSRYVTLQQIGEMVRAGEEVQIIDNATKEDKTEVTLALILSEDLKVEPHRVPLGTLRDLLQERGERLLTSLREGPIGRLIPGEKSAEKPPEPPPAPEPPPQPATEEKTAKNRFNEIVSSSRQTLDQWQHAVDERIRAILPERLRETNQPTPQEFSDLQAEVRRLEARVAELEGLFDAISSKNGGGDARAKSVTTKKE